MQLTLDIAENTLQPLIMTHLDGGESVQNQIEKAIRILNLLRELKNPSNAELPHIPLTAILKKKDPSAKIGPYDLSDIKEFEFERY